MWEDYVRLVYGMLILMYSEFQVACHPCIHRSHVVVEQ